MNTTTNMSSEFQSLLEATRAEGARIIEDCAYSSKSHFNAADTWLRRHYYIGVPAILFGIATGAAIIKSYPDIGATLSLIGALLTGSMTFLKPSERASSHKAIADQYLALRNETRIFCGIELLQVTAPGAVLDRISSLSKRRNALNQGSPAIPWSAFAKARIGIEQGEARHAVDKEA